MLFKNTNEDTIVRIPYKGEYIWKTVKKGKKVDLPKDIGDAYGFKRIKPVEGKVHNKKVETKKFDEKLLAIKGMGKKSLKDLKKVFPTEKDLRDAVRNEKHIPLRNDLEKKIKKKFR